MTFDYIPTDEEIRDSWRGCLIPTGENTYEIIDEAQADAEYNSWVTEHDRKVAERVWDEAVHACWETLGVAEDLPKPVNPHKQVPHKPTVPVSEQP